MPDLQRPKFTKAAAMAALGLVAAGAFVAWRVEAAERPAGTFVGEHVTLRLVSAEPDAGGRLRSALLVGLDTGWKTYWIDPGDAGIPPAIDLSNSANIADAAVRYPAPSRFGDESVLSNGYLRPLAIALDLRERVPGETTQIRASVMLGICKDICIPVSADLAAEPERATAEDAAAVDAAFDALPRPSEADHGAFEAALSGDGKLLTVAAHVPSAAIVAGRDAAAELFVAGPQDWYFGRPAPARREGNRVTFDVPVLGRPRGAREAPLRVDAVLAFGSAAYETRGLEVSPRS